MRIAVDVGGTFTDVVLVDDGGALHYTKTFTTPDDLSRGVLEGIRKGLAVAGTPQASPECLVHGTTVGTNALIERRGAKTGLLTTAGFRDVLEIGRVQRPDEALYDFTIDNPAPLVPRYLRLEAGERIGADASVVVPLRDDDVHAAAEAFARENVEAVAVCFLFSFLHPEHERRTAEILRQALPETTISLSHEVAPEFREYERTSTTVLSAYLQPITERYVDRLEQRLREAHPDTDLRIVQASGGTMTADAARGRAIQMVNSGPAGGVVAAAYLGRLVGEEKMITVDMGGTSFDIGLVESGAAQVTSDGKFEGFPVKIPIIDVNIIGAGGGSIAWIDKGGSLNVGPRSAGAVPGPACYARGGESPTVTDANLILGRLNPAYFLGGEIALDPDLARRAMETHVAGPLGMSVEDAAAGILRVVNANMTKGISIKSTRKGYDLREFSLVPFGGAGPLHAAELAEELGMPRVIVPILAGAFSALGLLVSDTRHDESRTIMTRADQADPEHIEATFRDLETRARARLEEQDVPSDRRRIRRSADLRFDGQSYELNIPVEGTLDAAALTDLCHRFEARHEEVYSFRAVDEKTWIVGLRVTGIGTAPELHLPRIEQGGEDPADALKETRSVSFPGHGSHPTSVFDRERLRAGNVLPGPALVEEMISTTVIPPGATARVDASGNLVIRLTPGPGSKP